MDFLELKKHPKIDDGTALYAWAKFIAALSEEELYKVAGRKQDVKKALVMFRELTTDERIRDRIERREKARQDQAMFLKHTLICVAKKALRKNICIEDIVDLLSSS